MAQDSFQGDPRNDLDPLLPTSSTTSPLEVAPNATHSSTTSTTSRWTFSTLRDEFIHNMMAPFLDYLTNQPAYDIETSGNNTGGSAAAPSLITRYRNLVEWIMEMSSRLASFAIFMMGPVLIVFAFSMICALNYNFYKVVLRLHVHRESIADKSGEMILTPSYSTSELFLAFFHASMVIFLSVNVLFNYAMCVITRNNHESKAYKKVVRELATATQFTYPETDEEIQQVKRDYAKTISERRRRRLGQNPSAPSQSNQSISGSTGDLPQSAQGSSNSTSTQTGSNTAQFTPVRGWTLLGPQEWGFCMKSQQPKPPRAHYDSVTRNLVLNFDHFCPWVCNAVGYFNYRYFYNMLLYNTLAMSYGIYLCFSLYMNLESDVYYEQVKVSRDRGLDYVQHLYPGVPTPDEKSPIAFSFMICLCCGMGVFLLFATHTYLIFTGQTTLEFHANMISKHFARTRNMTWINPYNLGYKRNFQQVYGYSYSNPLIALLPSTREPEFLPLPIAGNTGKRILYLNKKENYEQLKNSLDVV